MKNLPKRSLTSAFVPASFRIAVVAIYAVLLTGAVDAAEPVATRPHCSHRSGHAAGVVAERRLGHDRRPLLEWIFRLLPQSKAGAGRKGGRIRLLESPTLKVPGDWNTQRESLFYYEGPLWYERDFTYSPKEHTRIFLHVGAANYRSWFWVNGQKSANTKAVSPVSIAM